MEVEAEIVAKDGSEEMEVDGRVVDLRSSILDENIQVDGRIVPLGGYRLAGESRRWWHGDIQEELVGQWHLKGREGKGSEMFVSLARVLMKQVEGFMPVG